MLFDDARPQMVTRARPVEYCAPTENDDMNYKQQFVTRARPTEDDDVDREIVMKKSDDKVKKPRPMNPEERKSMARWEQLVAQKLRRSRSPSAAGGSTNTAAPRRVGIRELEARGRLRRYEMMSQSTPKDDGEIVVKKLAKETMRPFVLEISACTRSYPPLVPTPLQSRPVNHGDQNKERNIREQLAAEELLRSKIPSVAGSTNTATQRVSVRDRLEARAMLRSNVHETIQSTPKDELLLRAMNMSEDHLMKEVAMGCLRRFLKEEAFDDGELSARELASLQQFFKKNQRFEAAVSCGEKLMEVKEKIHISKIEALHQEHDREMHELHSEINDLRRSP